MIAQFVVRLLWGLSLTWCLLPRQLVTSGFFRIQLLVSMGLGVLGTLVGATVTPEDLTGWPSPQRSLLAGVAMASFIGSALWTLERRKGGTICCFLVAALSLAAAVCTEMTGPLARPLGIATALSAGWLLGGTTCSMLLGHWHLTATAMSLKPLTRSIRLAMAALATRIVLTGVSVALADGNLRGELIGPHLTWTLLAIGAGLLGPLVLLPLALGTLRYRNTQSATGVLFATVVLLFLGESAVLLLREELHWPL